MKRPNRWAVLCCVVAIGAGVYWYFDNHLSNEDIEKTVQTTLQQKLDDGNLKDEHLHVQKVSVLHDQGNRYQAIATVEMNGASHDVPLHVLVDGRKVAWDSDAGAFAFVAQDMMQRSLAQFQQSIAAEQAKIASSVAASTAAQAETENSPSPTTDPASAPMPAQVQSLTGQWFEFNEQCRGGSGDDPATKTACDTRDELGAKIKNAGWCWGKPGDIEANRQWVECSSAHG